MSNHQPNSQVDDEDLFTLITVGWGFVPVVLAVAGAALIGTWHSIVGWLLAHDLLVPRRESPWIELPYSHGAGLDHGRVIVLAALLLVLIALMADATGRAIARRRTDQA